MQPRAGDWGLFGEQPGTPVRTDIAKDPEMRTNVIDDLLDGITRADLDASVWEDDAQLDATVPHWRFAVRGGGAIRDQLSGWYPAPGRFEELRRARLRDGEFVEFLLRWEVDGAQYACHQAHVLTVRNERIASHAVWCGGPWDEQLQAEMAAAASART